MVELILGVLLVVRVAGLALEDIFLVGIAGLANGFAKEPSLVPGLLPLLLPARLKLDPGRGGGPIGLSTGLKKLDRRRSFGVEGTDWRLSMVRSDKDGLDVFRACTGSGATYSSGSVTWSSRDPWREADRKLSKELSWSLFSSSS